MEASKVPGRGTAHADGLETGRHLGQSAQSGVADIGDLCVVQMEVEEMRWKSRWGPTAKGHECHCEGLDCGRQAGRQRAATRCS